MQSSQQMQRQSPPVIPNDQSLSNNQFYSSQIYSFGSSSLMQSSQLLASSDANISFESYSTGIPLNELSSTSSFQNSQPMFSQTFPVLYNYETFMVDPFLLMNSSQKFKILISPYIIDNQIIQNDICLEIIGQEFTNRNMNNFLRLCQSLSTDVQDSEMEEICKIAKMFQAEKIYNTGISFVQSVLNSNFNIPENKYDGSHFMRIQSKNQNFHHTINFNDLEFEDFDSNTNDHKENNINNIKNSAKDTLNNHKVKSIIYHVVVENHFGKLPIYRILFDGEILYSAKQKDNDIYIGKGRDIHINKYTLNHVGHIYQDCNKTNHILVNKNRFQLKYVESGKPNYLSLSVTFPNNDKKVTWIPKKPKFDFITNKYYLNFQGEYNRNPQRSKKNIVLANEDDHTVFILRKMSDCLFEYETLESIDPLTLFSIGLSGIVGPYDDHLNGL